MGILRSIYAKHILLIVLRPASTSLQQRFVSFFPSLFDFLSIGSTHVPLNVKKTLETMFSFLFLNSNIFSFAAKYREEFKLIIDRIAVVKSENVSKLLKYFYLFWEKLCSHWFSSHTSYTEAMLWKAELLWLNKGLSSLFNLCVL